MTIDELRKRIDELDEKLVELLKPCPSKWLEAYEVDTLINSPRNNNEEVLRPLK